MQDIFHQQYVVVSIGWRAGDERVLIHVSALQAFLQHTRRYSTLNQELMKELRSFKGLGNLAVYFFFVLLHRNLVKLTAHLGIPRMGIIWNYNILPKSLTISKENDPTNPECFDAGRHWKPWATAPGTMAQERNVWRAWCFCTLFLISTNIKSMKLLYKLCKKEAIWQFVFWLIVLRHLRPVSSQTVRMRQCRKPRRGDTETPHFGCCLNHLKPNTNEGFGGLLDGWFGSGSNMK